jgi:cytochrome c-type biogenesis protein CcmF
MIGSIVLTLALASSIFAMIMYYLNFKGYKNALTYGRIGFHSMAVLVIVASTILWYVILTHQYQFKYVYSYTSTDLPGGLLFATFWGGQEGSFMLWLLLTAIVGVFLQSYTAKRGDLEPRVMAVFALATTFLLIMVSPMFKNPFAFIWTDPIFVGIKSINPEFLSLSFLQSFMFSDPQTGQNFIKMTSELAGSLAGAGISVNDFIINGKGLNPQLINFWMQIHPPILFIGFAMATVPFAFAMAALMKNDYRDWVRQSFPWVLAGAGVLGLGIMLGGYWAYEMLGWGGYWAWDPVENSSLIPWIVGVASVHTMLVQRKSQAKGGIGKYAKMNLILAMMTYILVLYSTFLTRSGVLGDASVHSFVDPGMIVYLFLLIFIGTFILLGLGMMIYRWKYLNEAIVSEESLLSRDLALFTAAVILGASAIIILLGTSAPLFGTSVDTFFYDEMHIPLAIIIGLLNGVSLLLKWRHSTGMELMRKSVVATAVSILITAMVVIFGGVTDLMMILLTFSAAFSLIVNLEIAVKIVKGNLKMLGAYVSHIGIALFILGVVGSAAYSSETDLELVKDVPKEAFGYQLTFTGYYPIENNTKYAFNIRLQKDGSDYNIAPVMYISEFNNGLMREPSILTMATKDFYVSPLGYDEGKHDHGGTPVSLMKGETKTVEGIKLTFNDFNLPPDFRDIMMSGKDFQIGVSLTAEVNGEQKGVIVQMKNVNGQRELTSFTLEENQMNIALVNLDASGKVDLMVSPADEDAAAHEHRESLTITASVKPFINLVWAGVLVMVLGFFVSVSRRLKESSK